MASQAFTFEVFEGSSGPARNYRGWVIAAGISMMVLGTAAVIYDGTATIASVVLFGGLLMVAGALQIVHALQVRTWGGFFLYLLDGIVRATVGTLMVVYPEAGAQAITLVLSFYFVVAGVFRAVASSMLRFPSWGWSVASGVIAVALGVMLAMQWPASGEWFIGFAIGIDLLLSGWALLMFAAAVAKLSPSHA
jgi:uncharacterized membrane protein HdeD (DUF308 family)